MSEPTSTTSTIEDLPWGPGMITLAQPLPVEIQEDTDTEVTTIVADLIGQWGQGNSYEEALIDLGLHIEQWFDAATSVSKNKLSLDVREALEFLMEYLPEEVQP